MIVVFTGETVIELFLTGMDGLVIGSKEGVEGIS